MPLIEEIKRIDWDWEVIFEKIKSLPGKTAASAKIRWENYLNPRFEYGIINDQDER